QPVFRGLVAEVGLVQRDVAERGAGAGRRIATQVHVSAVLLTAETACHPGTHGPPLAQPLLEGQTQPGVERVLVGFGAVASGSFAGEVARAQVTAEVPAGLLDGGTDGTEAGRQTGCSKQQRSAGRCA